MSITKTLLERRTISLFKPGVKPEKTKIITALEAACWAPNHRFTQPWRFYLLGDETAKTMVELNTEIVADAKGPEAAKAKQERWSAVPGWVVVTCQNSDDDLLQKEDYAACCCAIQNFQLSLWDEGVGVKWSTGAIIRDQRFYDLLWIDDNVETVVGLLWYGYPDEIPQSHRKPLSEVLIELP